MRICYNCFHTAEDSTDFCKICGFPLDFQNENTFPDALPCGTTLYGRYLIGQVIKQDDSSIIYIAQDSRTKGTVAVKELFPKPYAKRSSMRNVLVPEENRDAFQETREGFLEEAEFLSDQTLTEEDGTNLPPCVQSYFSQNDTSYLVIDYGTEENLKSFLDGKDLWIQSAEEQNAGVYGSGPQGAAGQNIGAYGSRPQDAERQPAGAHSSGPQDDAGQNIGAYGSDSQGAAGPNTGAYGSDTQSVDNNIPSQSGEYNFHQAAAETYVEAAREASFAAPTSVGTNEKGDKKSSVLPAVIVFGIIAVFLLILFFLLPSILAGIQYAGQGLQSQYEKYKAEKQENEKQKKNPFKDIFVGNDDDNEDVYSGITSGNYHNKGSYIQYNEEYFFEDGRGLFRTSDEDLFDYVQISNNSVKYLNEYEGYLYYLNELEGTIICLNPDDESTYVVYDHQTEQEYVPETIYIYDGWCYFSNGRNLYRFSMEDTGESTPVYSQDLELILEDFNAKDQIYESLCFLKGRLVYNGTDGITAVNPDGTDPELISDQNGTLITDGEDIFCSSGAYHIYRIGMDGTCTELLNTNAEEIITSFNCAGDWLYFTYSEHDMYNEVWRMSKDGEETEYLTDVYGNGVLSLCTFDDSDYIFLYLLAEEEGKYIPIHESVSTEW